MKLLHLQGLRAVAITSVVLFHFFPNSFPNGFLGVDVFFVLSGYLMSIILSKLDRLGIPEIRKFLYRRFRRITPLYYLMTLFILVSLKWVPRISWETNRKSALKTITFTMNLLKPSNGEGYFEKLGLAVDMFTHFWSLAVEVQFYVIFPIFFVVLQNLPKRLNSRFIALSGCSSIFIHFWTEPFFSFNSVLARIWQFLAGMIVYKAFSNHKEVTEKSSFVTMNSCFSLILVLLWKTPIDPKFSRCVTVILTSLIINIGHGFWPLENEISVLIGDVSYCWYLLHWPMVANLLLNKITDPVVTIGVLLGTLVVAVIIHFMFEKQYLTWTKKTIFMFVVVLILANVVVLHTFNYDVPKSSKRVLNSKSGRRFRQTKVHTDLYFYRSDNYNFGPMGYENMTNEEKIKFQKAFDVSDVAQTEMYYKNSIQDKRIPILRHLKLESNSSNMTLMVIGNSAAQNLIGLFEEECMSGFKSLHIAATPGCEPLVRTKSLDQKMFDCTVDEQYSLAVQYVQPDVLFVLFRYIDSWIIENGQSPFNDEYFKTAVSRLKAYEQVVKKRIYLVDPWPETDPSITIRLNEYLSKGTPFDEQSFIEKSSQKVIIGKQRMVRLANGCSKCVIFDLTTMFYIDGRLTMYDPIHYISFVTAGLHFSPPGRERIRPLFKDLCQRK